MADALFVLIALSFLALCAAYVRGCERIIQGAMKAESGRESGR